MRPPPLSSGHSSGDCSASANSRWRAPTGSGLPFMVASRTSTARFSPKYANNMLSCGRASVGSAVGRRANASPCCFAHCCSHIEAVGSPPCCSAANMAATTASRSITRPSEPAVANRAEPAANAAILSVKSPKWRANRATASASTDEGSADLGRAALLACLRGPRTALVPCDDSGGSDSGSLIALPLGWLIDPKPR